ncbi:hypothetical protein K501DRAFT_205380 [Backusella circina FSU 941]|nr:hypothetical protein K501DRAFT_235731 [Backusella circina FSU 941]KAI8890901.1 hypothetical protein K501DRAFT_205380 [Backusella circina FSU 941]
MEAIDEYANENIVRSVAFTALEQRQRHNYAALISISSQILHQRVHFLGPQKSRDDPAEWDMIVQWQEDNCPALIESLWSSGGSVADEFYQKPVYYKRMDADTLHAIIEFAERDTKHYVVILLLEEGNGDISDIKYNNTKELSQDEWLDVFANWSRSLEDAERVYLTKVTRHKKIFSAGAPDTPQEKESAEDYWGEWSSDEEGSQQGDRNKDNKDKSNIESKDSDDSEDEYYTRWSKNPGTDASALTASRGSTGTLQAEMDEEYDQSYNPLFTVPSVPNLMDAHTAALSELTNMLQKSLPQQTAARNNRVPFVQPMTQINPLPKAVSRLKSGVEDVNISNNTSEEDQPEERHRLPGAYPESGTQSPLQKLPSGPEELAIKNKEAGRGLFMKSLRALIGAARLLGYEGKDILEMVREIVDNP